MRDTWLPVSAASCILLLGRAGTCCRRMLTSAPRSAPLLQPFEACSRDAAAASFMCSYNRGEDSEALLPPPAACHSSPAPPLLPAKPQLLPGPAACVPAVNGKPSCVNRGLLQGTLRGNLGFKGFVVTDCTGERTAAALAVKIACCLPWSSCAGLLLPTSRCVPPAAAPTAALTRMVQPPPHGPFIAQGSTRRASALAIQAGTDMACHSFDALYPGDVTKVQLDTAVRRVLTARVRWGGPCLPCPWPLL